MLYQDSKNAGAQLSYYTVLAEAKINNDLGHCFEHKLLFNILYQGQ
jgi:hypothetical protein